MKIYIMTDLEGVAGVLNFDDWCQPSGRYYDLAKEFLTEEANAAVRGFYAAGATEVAVADGHGHGGLDPARIDPRVELLRGWPPGSPYPFGLDDSFAFAAWVGQHAKSGTEYAHLAHTGWFNCLDYTLNGISVGEFGQMAFCASELGVRTILACGDLAFTREAQALFPGIETAAVKRGVTPGSGDDLNAEDYARRNLGAVHVPPVRARALIEEAARRALERAQQEDFGRISLPPPYTRVVKVRGESGQPPTVTENSHPRSVIALLNG